MDPGANPANEDLTWPALLAQWMDFARATGRLAPSPENDRWRHAAAPIISLQAVACALAELGRLPPAQRAEAIDLAGVIVRKEAGLLHGLWDGEPPHEITLLIADARAALAAAAGPPGSEYPSPGVPGKG